MKQPRSSNLNGSDGESAIQPLRRRPAPRVHIALNLTAMIDIVFLLLVYFMVATEFKLGEEVYQLDLPDRSKGMSQLDPFDLDEQPLRINVITTGDREDAYRLHLDGPYVQPTSFENLHEFLRTRMISENVQGGLFAPNHPIIVQPTGGTRWSHAVEAFSAAARAHYTNITFSFTGS